MALGCKSTFVVERHDSSLVVMSGSISGPVLAGLMADTLGSYRLGFVLLAALAVAGSGLFALARKPS